jgi:hypothetical protein
MKVYVVMAFTDDGDLFDMTGLKEKENYIDVYREYLENEDVCFCELEEIEVIDYEEQNN